MQSFIAGGAVRDLLLGRCPSEFDIVFEGTAEDFIHNQPVAVHAVGKSMSVYICRGHEHMPLRSNIQKDLYSRDLTINAMLLDERGIIHALPSTFADLCAGIIRHASPTAFLDDPVRVFRAARFFATLPDFTIAAKTKELMREAASRQAFTKISSERVGNEVIKAMSGPLPGNFFRALAESEAESFWFPIMKKAHDIPSASQQYHKKKSIFSRICEVMDSVATLSIVQKFSQENRRLACWMAMCHGASRVETASEVSPRHIGHDQQGLDSVRRTVERLRLPKRWEKAGLLAVSLHIQAKRYLESRPGSKVDLLMALSKTGFLEPFCALIMADSKKVHLGERILRDATLLSRVKLPEQFRNQGKNSGDRLRFLRIDALIKSA